MERNAKRRWRRRIAVACLLPGALACTPDAPPPPAPERPLRVVLVSIDTLRADHVGAYGAGPGRTPALDALAATGVRFENAITPAPITLPSHTTLLTGLDPPEHGIHHNGLFRLRDDVPTLAAHLREAGYATAAFVGSFVLAERFGLARGFDVYDDTFALGSPSHGGVAVAERPADQVVDAALAWLAAAPDRSFLFVHLYDPHAEHQPPEPFATRHRGNLYAGEIAFADAEVGRLLDAVAARWPDGATLVAVTSDHGESLGEHGEDSHSFTLYDATQRVPLLLRGPGLPAGVTVAPVVRLADVAPTLLAALGASPLPGATGRPLQPLLAGPEVEPRSAYLETLATHYDWRWSPVYGIRTATHKYLRAPRPELYDLRADPGETHDLAATLPELAATLDRALDERLAGRSAPRPNLALDPAERARLEALGYVAPVPAGPGQAPPLGTVGGTDPKDELFLVGEMHRLNELLGAQRFDEALAVAGELGERGLEIGVLQLRAALGAGRYEQARALAERLIRELPEEGRLHALLGRILEARGDAPGATAAYERALALEAPSALPLTGLGRLAEAAGRTEESRSWYERARQAPIPDAEPTWRLAALALEAGDVERGGALLRALPRGYLRHEDAALRVAGAELAAGRAELARIRVEAALQDAPESTALLTLRARILDALGALDELVGVQEALLARFPDHPIVQNDLAWTLFRLGRELPRAHALARAAVEGSGRRPEALDTLAAIQIAQGQLDEAGRGIEEGLAGAEGLARAQLLLRRAELLAARGERDAARAALAEAGAAAGEPHAALAAEEERVRARVAGAQPPPIRGGPP
ncbi:MAG: sulfatase-like hydrolase/transferase [Deltaproteobacteria bacterium]|nr:sulfatase-like hydrolase/transferase [Deltaproteobacteria bacterium]